MKWTAVSDQSWCNIPVNIGAGKSSVAIICDANTTTSTRTATVTLTAKDLPTKTIPISQAGIASNLILDVTIKTVTSTASNFAVNVTSNANWTAGSNSTTWCNVSSGSGSGNSSITITCTENTSTSSRSAIVTFSVSGATSQTLIVIQSGKTYSLTYLGATVTVTGRTFQMGSTTGSSDEQPVHSVTVSAFQIGKYEVTNQEFADFLNAYGQSTVKTGEYFGQTMIYENSTGGLVKSGATWAPATGKGNYPIINVTWYRANEFCKYYGGRLPTEAEWEFAARGGNSSKNYLYSGSNTVGDVAWYVGNASYTNTVGTKTANELGIYDMSGNVYEWCNDWYDVYLSSGQTNPTGASGGTYRVLRGGSWFNYNYSTCRASERDYSVPNNYNDSFGFRFVR